MEKCNDSSNDTVWTFYIRTFPYFGESKVLSLQVSSNHQLLYKDVKDATAQLLGLQLQSGKLFGLFKLLPGIFITPLKLCLDDNKVAISDNYGELGFLRLSCNKKEELEVIKNDVGALDLIYWEAANLLEVGDISEDNNNLLDLIFTSSKINGSPGLDLIEHKVLISLNENNAVQRLQGVKCKNEYLKLASNCTSANQYIRSVFLREKRSFLNTMYKTVECYWHYFYKVLGCRLCGDDLFLLTCYLGLNEDLHCDIILSSTSLSMLSYNQSESYYNQLLSIPWGNIRSVHKDSSLQMFHCHILCEDKDSYVSYMSASFCTKQYEYLYTMSVYFLDKHQCQCNKRKKSSGVSDQKLSSRVPPNDFNSSVGASSKLIIPDMQIDPFDDNCYVNKSFVPALLSIYNAYYMNYSLQQESKSMKFSCSKCDDKTISEAFPSYFKQHIGSATRDKYSSQLEKILFSKSEEQDQTVNDVRVFAFTNTSPILVKTSKKIHTIGALKMEVGRKLNLVSQSLCIFGLFTCSDMSYENPIRLCLENNEIPQESLCFRRLSFNKGLEKTICRSDHAALELLFYEAKYMVKNELLYPSLSPADFKMLGKITEMVENCLSDNKQHRLMEHFMEALISLSSSWWHFYYIVKVNGCNLFDSMDCYTPLPCTASLTIDHISLSDNTGTSIIHIPWSKVSSILMQESTGASVSEQLKIEVVTDILADSTKPNDKILTAIPIDTTSGHFFFSVAKHIMDLLGQQQKKNKAMERQRLSDTQFINTTYKGPGYLFYFPDPVSQHINPTFTGTDYINIWN